MLVQKSPLKIEPNSRPVLARHAVLRHDRARDLWLILVPEKVLVPEPTAVAILQLADGIRDVAEIAQDLAKTYAAPQAEILADALVMLQDLADRGFLRVGDQGADA